VHHEIEAYLKVHFKVRLNFMVHNFEFTSFHCGTNDPTPVNTTWLHLYIDSFFNRTLLRLVSSESVISF
jgi:hypothetical protein